MNILADDALAQALALFDAGRLDQAALLCDLALSRESRNFRALYLAGVVAYRLGDAQKGVDLLDRAIAVVPNHPKSRNHLGLALLELGQSDAALTSFDSAIALDPDLIEAHHNKGNALLDQRRYEAALASFDRALHLDAAHVDSHVHRGLALHGAQRHEAAILAYDEAIALRPNAAAYNFRGNARCDLMQFEAALDDFDAALRLLPGYAEAHNSRGSALAALKRYEDALRSYALAIESQPGFAAPFLNRGNVLKELGRPAQALASYDDAIARDSDLAEAYFNRGDVQRSLGRFAAAVADFDRAHALNPNLKNLLGQRRHLKMQLCDWEGLDADLRELDVQIGAGRPATPPFALLALSDSAELQKRAADIWVRTECPCDDSLQHPSDHFFGHRSRTKIHVGYFSADFRDHPISYLTAELFEVHDKTRFEISAFAFGPDSASPLRARQRAAFDRFIEVRDKSDREIAALARDLCVDIAVDLGGFTEHCRTRIFALRAAPLQLSYLGYLGTMSAPYIDYLIADQVIVPPTLREHYAEKLLYLPSYQVNDSRRRIADLHFSREALGLPPRGFVFCCFNASYKILPGTFALWMRILRRVRGSVLFLVAGEPVAQDKLRAEARARGIDASRLVFGARLPPPEYLARYRAADLFLDTQPYNAGTTASDALWVGLPVLTLIGETFAGRVAASLLTAVELPELIATTAQQYEDVAVALAGDPRRFAALKAKLADRGARSALFDTPRFAKHLEAGYTHICGRRQLGLPPEDWYANADSLRD